VSSFEIAQIIVGAFQTVATILIAVVLYRQAQGLKRIEVHSNAINAYNLINSVAVSSAENLAIFEWEESRRWTRILPGAADGVHSSGWKRFRSRLSLSRTR
jgi:hypothetical protein